MLFERGEYLGIRAARHPKLANNDQVQATQRPPMMSEALANQALDPIAANRRGIATMRDSQPKTR
jgi:hypothetical protein